MSDQIPIKKAQWNGIKQKKREKLKNWVKIKFKKKIEKSKQKYKLINNHLKCDLVRKN